jgi:hypothetical protein
MGKRRKRPGKPALDSRIRELQVAKLEQELEKTNAETIKIRHENEKLLHELKQLKQFWLFKPQWAAVYGPLLIACISLKMFYKTNSFQQERMLAKLEQTYLSHEKDSLLGKVVHYERYVTTLKDSVDSYKNHWLQLQSVKATYGNAYPKKSPDFSNELSCDMLCSTGHYSMRGLTVVAGQQEFNDWKTKYLMSFPAIDSTIRATDEEVAEFIKYVEKNKDEVKIDLRTSKT